VFPRTSHQHYLYIPPILIRVVWALRDGEVSLYELDSAETQSITKPITARMAILVVLQEIAVFEESVVAFRAGDLYIP